MSAPPGGERGAEVFLRLDLPPVPTLPHELVAEWEEAHRGQDVADEGLPAPVRRAVWRWTRDRCMEGLAGVTPSIGGMTAAPLFPAPRAFLSATDRARIAGCVEAFRHVDVRLRLAETGDDPTVVLPETVFVLHALAEGQATGGFVTNPGQLRVNPTAWAVSANPYELPPPEVVRHLLNKLVADAPTMPGPTVAVAGWAAFCLMSIHPFVDGNGRTARLLYALLASRGLDHPDLGAVDLATQYRREYVDALQAGQWTTPHWDPERLDPTPFTMAMARWSIEAARRQEHRLHVVAAALRALDDAVTDLSDVERGVVIHTWLVRVADPRLLVEPGTGTTEVRATAPVPTFEALARRGALERMALPPSRRQDGRAATGYRVAPDLAATLGRAGVDVREGSR